MEQRPRPENKTAKKPEAKTSAAKKSVHKSNTGKKKQSSQKSVFLVIVITALIILVVFAFATLSSPGDEEAASGTQEQTGLSDSFNSVKTGFPLSFPSGIDGMSIADSSIYVISRNTVSHFDLSGKKSKEHIFNFASPVIKTSLDYAIVYDRQGISYAVMNRDKIIYEGKNDDGEYINSACIADNGSFLIASRSTKGAGMLTYYSKTGEVLFQWLCANEYIVNCSISQNTKNLACSAISAKSGEMYTKVYYFDIDKSDNNKEYTFNGAVSLDTFFVGSRNVIAVCQDRRILIDFSKDNYTPIEKLYTSTILKQSSDEGGNTAVVLKKDDSFDKTSLTVYDSHNNISFECDLPDDIRDICLKGGKAYILTGDAIYKADKDVSLITTLTSVNSSIVAGKRKIYYYTSSVINRLN